MNVLQHTRNELNLCLKENRPDRSYRDTLLIVSIAKWENHSLGLVINVKAVSGQRSEMMYQPIQSQESAETKPRSNFPESRIGFLRQHQLS